MALNEIISGKIKHLGCAPGKGFSAVSLCFLISQEQWPSGEEVLLVDSLQRPVLVIGRFAEGGSKQITGLLFGPWRDGAVPKCMWLTPCSAIHRE